MRQPITSENTILWDESHDTYMDGSTTSLTEIQRGKIWALCAGRATITTVYFARPDDSTNTNPCYNIKLGEAKMTSWSNETTKAINRFHNYFIGQEEYCTDNQYGWAYIERGTTGAILVHRGDATSGSVNLTNHKLKNGVYKDSITGNKFTVKSGKITGNVGKTGVACIYYDEESNTQPPTVFGQGKLMGDTDEDDEVTIFDATRIQRVLADIDKKGTYYDVLGDVDQDKDVSILDATVIQRWLAGMKQDEKIRINVRVGGGSQEPVTQPPTEPDETILPKRDGCYTVIFTNSEHWTGDINLYYWLSGNDSPLSWPGEQMEFYDTNEFNQSQYFGFVPEEYDHYIISAGTSGSPKTVDCPISADIGVWPSSQSEEGVWTVGTWSL